MGRMHQQTLALSERDEEIRKLGGTVHELQTRLEELTHNLWQLDKDLS